MEAKKVKPYSIEFKFSVTDTEHSYSERKVVSVNVTETLPVNVDPHKYLRSRVAEELSRAFGALHEVIANKTAEATEEDPLAA